MKKNKQPKNKNIVNKPKHAPKFELVLQIRDSLGNPTGKTKSFSTDYADQLESFYLRNAGFKKQSNT